MEASFDGGRTFTALPVTADGAGRFMATLQNPASAVGVRPTLRFTGTDGAGDSVVQTVVAAYRVAG